MPSSDDATPGSPRRELLHELVLAHARLHAAHSLLAQRKRETARRRHLEPQFVELVRACQDLLRGPLHANAAGVEHDDVVGLGRLGHDVGHHNDGHAPPVELPDDLHEAVAPARVEHGRRLVQHEHLGLHRKRPRNGDALLLATGERVGLVPLEAREPHLRERAPHAGAQFLRRHAQVLGAKRHVVLDERGHELVVRVLEHHAHARAHVVDVLGIRRVEAVDRNAARVGDQKRVEVLRERGLARAVTAKHAREAAARNGEPHAVEREPLPVVRERDVPAGDDGLGTWRRSHYSLPWTWSFSGVMELEIAL